MAIGAPPLPPVDANKAAADTLNLRAGAVRTREEAEKVAADFERMFIAEMLQPMFSGLSTEAPFGGGVAEDTFRPMLLDQYADAISESGGIGIADSVLSELLRIQGIE